MDITQQQWFNENEGRSYPIAETATGVDNNGVSLPNDIVVDLSIMLPTDYEDAYISSVWVTTHLIGLSITHEDKALASVMVKRDDYTPYSAVPLTPMPGTTNVSGWVAFGNNRTIGKWLFDGSTQSGLEEKAKHALAPLPVTSMRKLGGATSQFADQLVTLAAAGYIEIEAHPTDSQIIIVKLGTPTVRSLFLGPCNTLADLGDCGVPPLRKINNVCGDAEGVVTIVLE